MVNLCYFLWKVNYALNGQTLKSPNKIEPKICAKIPVSLDHTSSFYCKSLPFLDFEFGLWSYCSGGRALTNTNDSGQSFLKKQTRNSGVQKSKVFKRCFKGLLRSFIDLSTLRTRANFDPFCCDDNMKTNDVSRIKIVLSYSISTILTRNCDRLRLPNFLPCLFSPLLVVRKLCLVSLERFTQDYHKIQGEMSN